MRNDAVATSTVDLSRSICRLYSCPVHTQYTEDIPALMTSVVVQYIVLYNARFYQLGITRESRVIPGISNSSVLSTPNLGLFLE